MTDVIDLAIPVRADLVVLARLTAATVAGRAGFGVEDIEDLRLAVDELCLSVVDADADGQLRLRYSRDDDAIEISCTFEPTGALSAGPNDLDHLDDDLSSRILDALVDEHGHDGGAPPRVWLRKRRAQIPV